MKKQSLGVRWAVVMTILGGTLVGAELPLILWTPSEEGILWNQDHEIEEVKASNSEAPAHDGVQT